MGEFIVTTPSHIREVSGEVSDFGSRKDAPLKVVVSISVAFDFVV